MTQHTARALPKANDLFMIATVPQSRCCVSKQAQGLAENECDPGSGSGEGLMVDVKKVKSAGG